MCSVQFFSCEVEFQLFERTWSIFSILFWQQSKGNLKLQIIETTCKWLKLSSASVSYFTFLQNFDQIVRNKQRSTNFVRSCTWHRWICSTLSERKTVRSFLPHATLFTSMYLCAKHMISEIDNDVVIELTQ